MLLSDYRQLFRQYVTQTASFYDIHEEYVEKDYWLVLLLKHILFRDCGYIFKGGTSLSKCYHLINRFSEDIDLTVKVLPEESKTRNIKRLKQSALRI